MKKEKFLLLCISAFSAFIITFSFHTIVEAAVAEETVGMTLKEIGQSEREFAETADPAQRYVIESTWRKRINEIGVRLEKRGVKITKGVLDAIIESLGIGLPIGPLTDEDFRELGWPLPAIDRETVEKYLGPHQYVEDIEEEISPDLKHTSASPAH